MINLLPPAKADAIRYGRQNARLAKWLVGAAAAIVVLIIILVGGAVYLNQQSTGLQTNIDTSNQQLKAQNLAKVQADAKQIAGDARVINQVLSSEVDFSQLLQTIGTYMPKGTVLSSLSLAKVSGGIDLSAKTTDYASAAQIAVNLSDPKNELFSKVDIVSIACNSADSGYKCTATYRALFSKTAQTKFLSVPRGQS